MRTIAGICLLVFIGTGITIKFFNDHFTKPGLVLIGIACCAAFAGGLIAWFNRQKQDK